MHEAGARLSLPGSSDYSTISIKRWETGTLKPGAAAESKLAKLAEAAGRWGVVIRAA